VYNVVVNKKRHVRISYLLTSFLLTRVCHVRPRY